MNDTIIIMLNMRGSCASVGDKVHALFRVNNRRSAAKKINDPEETIVVGASEQTGLAEPGRAP
jgi:hypothetical protein